ncbi:hypothetical protein EVAR_39729_1 [Eumeta japonica]|uniref:Uncharacterized protein n=1 Tax=Eumeta variegata TaxID=151549 RepID=A0A4C1W5K4_EUMVA|nr:hypothetical protein EVAR_39729_1 [Eumeta japonica]
MRSLRSMCAVSRKDRRRNSDVIERCGLKEDVVTRVERGIPLNSHCGVKGGNLKLFQPVAAPEWNRISKGAPPGARRPATPRGVFTQ